MTPSRQRLWQIKNQQLGKCTQCSVERIHHYRLCDQCYIKYIVQRGSKKRTTRCGICNTQGHNRRSCIVFHQVMGTSKTNEK